jgi:hypothetical protein
MYPHRRKNAQQCEVIGWEVGTVLEALRIAKVDLRTAKTQLAALGVT